MKKGEMQAEINKQINAELYASYLYLAMAAYFEEANLSGMATWMKEQSKEEVAHAMKFYGYVHDRGWAVKLTAIAAPKSSWKSPLAAFEESLAHEKLVTKKINALMDLAIKSKDYASQSMLNWFIDEQVEEEASVGAIIEKMKVISKHPHMLLMLDAELGARKG